MSRPAMLSCTHDTAALRAVLKSDFDTLSGDTSSAPQISAVIEHLLQTTLAIARDLARDWNASRSGTCLPSEILANAFQFLPLRDRITASHVSHHWRQSALAFPEVWNHIDPPPGHRNPVALVELALSRSGRVPVVISYTIRAHPKGALALVHVLLVVQRSRLHDVGLYIQNLRADAIVSFCKRVTSSAVELDVIMRRGGDGGFALTIHKSDGLIRRLLFAGIPPRANGRAHDPHDVVGLVLRQIALDGLHSLSIDSTILSTLPHHLPAGLRRLTIHMRDLDDGDDPEGRIDGIALAAYALVRSTMPWESLDALPRLTTRMRGPVDVQLQMHGCDLRAEDAQLLLDKITSLELSHPQALRVRGFCADVVSAVSAHRAVTTGRVVFETQDSQP